jgi:hypothetical protein
MPDLLEAMDMHFDARMDEVHTAFPAVVESYSGHRNKLATVTPMVDMRMSNGVLLESKPIANVPVVFPCSVDGGMLFPLKKGDGVLVIVSEVAIGNWINGKGAHMEAEDGSRFTLHDAMCIPCLWAPGTGPVPHNYEETDAWFGLIGAGAVTVSKDGRISMHNANTSLLLEMQKMWDAIKALNDIIQKLAPISASPGSPCAPDPASTAFAVQGSLMAENNKGMLKNFLK